MRKRTEQKRAIREYGKWSIVLRGNRYYRVRYNPDTGTEDRFSLGTSDLSEAEARLADFVAKEFQPKSAAPAEIPLAWVLDDYYRKHAANLPSFGQARIEIAYWLEHFGEAMVSDLTPVAVDGFIAALRKSGKSDGYVSRVLSSGRAAVRRSYRLGHITSAPFIRDVETKEDRRNKQPKGRPLSAPEMAKLLDAVESEHLWRFMLLMICTMARPDAVLDLTAGQVDWEMGTINLLSKGKKQTNKRRPIVPIADTLRPWLQQWGDGLFVTYDAAPVNDIKNAWRRLRAKVWPADFSADPEPASRAERRARSLTCGPEGEQVNPYSIRHTMGRYLRRNKVPGDEISLMLGHLPVDENDVTGIYSPHDPDYCTAAVAVIDRYCMEVQKYMKVRKIIVVSAAEIALPPPKIVA